MMPPDAPPPPGTGPARPAQPPAAQPPGSWRVLRLALPIVLSNLSVPLVGLVDTAVMGRLPDPAFIGAVALGAVLFSFLYWGFGFLRMGTTGLVAREFGRRDGLAARELLGRNLVLAFGLGLTILVAQWPIALLAGLAFPASAAVEGAMLEYFAVRVWAAPAVLANYVLMGLFVGMQRTGLALLAQLVLNLGNAALSLLFVIGLGWGIAGVAAASVIAEFASLAVAASLASRALGALPARWPLERLRELAGYRPLLAVNANIFVRTLSMIFAFAWFNARGAAMGDLVLAVNAVLLQMLQLLSFGLDGFAHAAEALVGSAIGRRSRRDLDAAMRVTTAWAAGTALLYSLAYAGFADSVVALLTTIEAVRALAAQFTPWMAVLPLLAVWSYQLDGIFIGALRTAEMRNAMLVSLLAFLAASAVAVPGLGNHGLWAALAVFFVVRALTLGWYLRRLDLLSSDR